MQIKHIRHQISESITAIEKGVLASARQDLPFLR